MINLELLNRKLKEKNLKQKDLADMLGLRRSSITGWKNGADPKVRILVQICEILDVSADDLLGLKRKPPDEADRKEVMLIHYYQTADDRGKENILATAEREAKRKNDTG